MVAAIVRFEHLGTDLPTLSNHIHMTDTIVKLFKRVRMPATFLMLIGFYVARMFDTQIAKDSVLVILGLLVLSVLWDIYEHVKPKNRPTLFSDFTNATPAMAEKIQEALADPSQTEIKYLGVTLRYAWPLLKNALERNLRKGQCTNTNITLALVNWNEPIACETIQASKEMAKAIQSDIVNWKKSNVKKLADCNINIDLKHYRHTPNLIGLLVRGRSLFLGMTRWDGSQATAGENPFVLVEESADEQFSAWSGTFLSWLGRAV